MRPRRSATLPEHVGNCARNKTNNTTRTQAKVPNSKRSILVRIGVGTGKTKISDLMKSDFKNGQTKDLASVCYQKDKKVDDSFCNLLTM